MNHLSEWARFYDTMGGAYRYRHKGTGIVRNTLMGIGQWLGSTAEKVATTAATAVAKKAGERGSEKIQAILSRRMQSRSPRWAETTGGSQKKLQKHHKFLETK